MNENIKTEAFKIVEIKPGLYVQDYEHLGNKVRLTDDISKAMKFDVFSNEARPCARAAHGNIKELRVSWEVK